MQQLQEWRLLQEQKLELMLLHNIKTAKKTMLKNFDVIFTPEYQGRSDHIKIFIKLLIDTHFEPRIKYNQIGWFQFKKFTFPVKVRDFFTKQEGIVSGDIVANLSFIDPNPITTSLQNITHKLLMIGGQSVFENFKIEKQFQLINKNSLNWLRNYEMTLSNAITQEIGTKAVFHTLEGVRNLESTVDIRKRIVKVWDELFDVVVPPKIDKSEEILRAGHSYQLSMANLALTLAKTEPSRAFIMGKLVGFEQTGVIKEVETVIPEEEKGCSSCNILEGLRYKISEAHGIFPLHPGCKCNFDPIIDNYTNEKININLKRLYETD